MKISEMIEVLQAAERGEKIEAKSELRVRDWHEVRSPVWNFEINDYRIAPKKEMTLVEELREYGKTRLAPGSTLIQKAIDRIEFLENITPVRVDQFTTNELLEEIKRRC